MPPKKAKTDTDTFDKDITFAIRAAPTFQLTVKGASTELGVSEEKRGRGREREHARTGGMRMLDTTNQRHAPPSHHLAPPQKRTDDKRCVPLTPAGHVFWSFTLQGRRIIRVQLPADAASTVHFRRAIHSQKAIPSQHYHRLIKIPPHKQTTNRPSSRSSRAAAGRSRRRGAPPTRSRPPPTTASTWRCPLHGSCSPRVTPRSPGPALRPLRRRCSRTSSTRSCALPSPSPSTPGEFRRCVID
jgi:hypothetical protein